MLYGTNNDSTPDDGRRAMRALIRARHQRQELRGDTKDEPVESRTSQKPVAKGVKTKETDRLHLRVVWRVRTFHRALVFLRRRPTASKSTINQGTHAYTLHEHDARTTGSTKTHLPTYRPLLYAPCGTWSKPIYLVLSLSSNTVYLPFPL